jgi:hypothetical protein
MTNSNYLLPQRDFAKKRRNKKRDNGEYFSQTEDESEGAEAAEE